MNENELEHYEAELRGTRPAAVPKDFMARLEAAKPVVNFVAENEVGRGSCRAGELSAERFGGSLALPTRDRSVVRLWRWLAPALALAAAAVGLIAVRSDQSDRSGRELTAKSPASLYRGDGLRKAGVKADYVKMDEELVSSFDVIATLPSGEPVRFRCRQWQDQLSVTDKTNGVEITQNTPRVEVIPVRFETY